ncbi:MAG: hypothetical protein OQK94_03205 [Gammaproteobacteria bacterium]|nr:hypothetical protein [Gammaproteobacteria bacterium]MCW8841133.1 hypothetical protein [Gammaproteobacteria bacterium]MCW8928179.1 hypothetical protein [Gammaproteobacteria bacterium]MCW8959360.1 hypothetical protein [Gammaproteobacteria bacterium]MCW9089077.1 hypothetical protein [Gammaproteobacteria bacterium]
MDCTSCTRELPDDAGLTWPRQSLRGLAHDRHLRACIRAAIRPRPAFFPARSNYPQRLHTPYHLFPVEIRSGARTSLPERIAFFYLPGLAEC